MNLTDALAADLGADPRAVASALVDALRDNDTVDLMAASLGALSEGKQSPLAWRLSTSDDHLVPHLGATRDTLVADSLATLADIKPLRWVGQKDLPEEDCEGCGPTPEEKRAFSAEERTEAAEKHYALPDGSYPIKTVADLRNAIHAIGRAKDPDKVKAHIKKRAADLGREDLIPPAWLDGKSLFETLADSLWNEQDSIWDTETKGVGARLARLAGAWDPHEHPRDYTGEFSDKPGSPDTPPHPEGGPVAKPTTKWNDGISLTGKPDGKGTPEDPIAVGSDLDKAVRLLAEGKHVRLDQPDQVTTLVDKLREISADAVAKGQNAPEYDLCKVSVPGTNLFCKDSKGYPRAKMPQFSGKAADGSPAASRRTNPDDPNSPADVSDDFRQAMHREGIKTTVKRVPASHLRASQNQLDGPKVGGIANWYRSTPEAREKADPMFVTRDGYVIDGHHRWAALVALDSEDGHLGDIDLEVEVLDMDIGAAIDYANAFTRSVGIIPKGLGAAAEGTKAIRLARGWSPREHPRDYTGEFADKPGSGGPIARGAARAVLGGVRGGAPKGDDPVAKAEKLEKTHHLAHKAEEVADHGLETFHKVETVAHHYLSSGHGAEAAHASEAAGHANQAHDAAQAVLAHTESASVAANHLKDVAHTASTSSDPGILDTLGKAVQAFVDKLNDLYIAFTNLADSVGGGGGLTEHGDNLKALRTGSASILDAVLTSKGYKQIPLDDMVVIAADRESEAWVWAKILDPDDDDSGTPEEEEPEEPEEDEEEEDEAPKAEDDEKEPAEKPVPTEDSEEGDEEDAEED